MSVSVSNSGGTILINDGTNVYYLDKNKVDVKSQGNDVIIQWDAVHYVSYPYTQYDPALGATANAIAATIASYLDTGSEVGGSGTTNYISKWTASTTLGNSLLFDNGTTVQMGGTGALASAQFAMTSTTQGLLIPRMTTAQKELIGTPATGLIVFDTTLGLFSFYTGSAWASLDTGTNDYTQGGNAYAATGTLGLTDANTLNIITNNITRIGITSNGNITTTQSVQTSGSPTAINIVAGAHTTLTASTEATDVLLSLERQVQWATGAITTQRAVRVLAPIYRFVGASTITTAATFAIEAAPTAGANATLTNSYALWVQAGTTKLDGTLSVLGTGNLITSTATATGALTLLTLTSAAHTNQTASTEISSVNANLSATRQWATGAITTQREFLIQAPTYAFVGASTITTAATLAISAAPIAGANATITTPLALWVQSGETRLVGSGTTSATYALRTYNSTPTEIFSVRNDERILGNNIGTNADVNFKIYRNDVVGFDFRSGFVFLGNYDSGAAINLLLGTLSGSETNTRLTSRASSDDGSTFAFRTGDANAKEILNVRSDSKVVIKGGTTNPSYGATFEIVGATATPAATAFLVTNSTPTTLFSIGNSGRFAFTQIVEATGAPAFLTYTSAAHTAMTASTEIISANFNFSATKQWATGAITTQREFLIQAPTYAFVGASTITTAATLAISAAPIAGTNATLTNSYALWVQAGASTFDGRMLKNQGADVASASTIALGSDGNVFEITGTTTIDLITSTGWRNGAVVTLVFNASVTVNHATATSGANVTILLAGAANFAATANDTLTLVLCETTAGGQAWRELARTAI